MHRGEHLSTIGLQSILNLRASLNIGLSDALLAAFPNTVPVDKDVIDSIFISHPQWVAGFTSGEGCFFVFVSKSSTHALGHRVQLVFQITQHSRDIKLIGSLITYFGCGRLAKSEFYSKVQYRVEGFTSNYDIIREFFINHNITLYHHYVRWKRGKRGVKSQDFKVNNTRRVLSTC